MFRKFILAVATAAALIVGFSIDSSSAQARPWRGYYGGYGYGAPRAYYRGAYYRPYGYGAYGAGAYGRPYYGAYARPYRYW